MTACVLHGVLPASQSWLCEIGVAVYDFQTLIGSVLAIGAAYYAARPVWRQLKNTNLQTKIEHRETLASLLRAIHPPLRFDQRPGRVLEPLLFEHVSEPGWTASMLVLSRRSLWCPNRCLIFTHCPLSDFRT